MKKNWAEWLENGEVVFTRTGKRKRASYEMVAGLMSRGIKWLET